MMKTIGFPISHKENENRRALLPTEVRLIKHPEMLFFETGYGNVLGIQDVEYIEAGANVVSRDEILKKDIICDPKIGDADYLNTLSNQVIFGWIHAVQNRSITDILIKNHLIAYAWEDMFEDGRHIFWRNNELAGEAAVMHAFQCYGKMPYQTNCAVIGTGNTARGAVKVLNMLGANVIQYNRHTENLLRKEIGNYDVIVNCVLWDVKRHDHIIYKDDLNKMKHDSMIIDVSCDRNGGIETSVPTTIENPTYFVNNVLHYVVDHTPSLFYKTFSYDNSKVIYHFLNELVEDNVGEILQKSCIIKDGIILEDRIKLYQNR